MKTPTGATPLIALDSVAVDTETTSLDASKARVVQIGAVTVAGARVLADPSLDQLVNPGEPIPAIASAVHGIADADVAAAPSFAEAWRRFADYADGRVLVGHSIGYDLAVFDRECRRAGIGWTPPRTLCVRLLATVAKPDLPDHSLDMIAAWLGVPVRNRHSALGDARAAADVFVALVPRLLERGIRTLAEAERACLGLAGELESAHRAGWKEPVAAPSQPRFEAVDPFAYRHRVGDLMSSPPLVEKASATVRDVVGRMAADKVGALFVSPGGEAGAPVDAYGIVTERDIVRRLAADGPALLDQGAGDVATRPLASIRAAAFVYRAVGRMDRLGIRHLAVRDDSNRLIGMISARDVLRLRASSAIQLDDAIEHAATAADMAAAWATLPSVARGLIAESVDARIIAAIVSDELCAMTRRAAVLCERAMQEAGKGPPPVPYSLLVLGSGGRGESLLAADQDNAIVFAEGEPDGPEDRWFADFGERLAATLNEAGIPLCKGGVMARNPQFRGSIDLWMSRVDGWVRRSNPADLLNVDIVFDLLPVHGDATLGARLFEHAYERGQAEKTFAKLLGEQLVPGNPFTLFGGLQTDGGRIDLKLHGLFPIVTAARALAIRHGVRRRSTRDRLEGLMALDIGGDADLAAMLSGHVMLLQLLLAQQSRDLFDGTAVSNRVVLASLDRRRQDELKELLKRLRATPDLIRDLMFA
ncbi:MAG: CBS domain-containing protein [Rhizobiaceae bacterium]|nr:CBS domain-containing protein [Rhizobiaceae bacterium]